MQRQRGSGSKGWEHLRRFLIDLSNSGWIRLIAKVTTDLLVALAVLALMLIIGFRYIGLQVKGNGVYLGSIEIGRIYPDPNQTLGTHITVEATAGFQNSGIYLKKGDTVSLEPEGRVHLALRQIYTFAGLAKSLTAAKLPATEEYNNYKSVNKPLDFAQDLTEDNIFRRDWTGSDGEEIDSKDLNQCLFFLGNQNQKGRWGMLLAQVMENPGSATSDPFQVLIDNKLDPSDLIPIPNRKDLEAARDGWLTFIINDAVISKNSQPKPCKDYYEALTRASEDLRSRGDDNHRIPILSIPLVWYTDNAGAFHVTVRYGNRVHRAIN